MKRIIATLTFIGSFVILSGYAEAKMSRSEYIGRWTAACMGTSQRLSLSPYEAAMIIVAGVWFEGKRTNHRHYCSCAANYIAARKKNLKSATPESLAEHADQVCIDKFS